MPVVLLVCIIVVVTSGNNSTFETTSAESYTDYSDEVTLHSIEDNSDYLSYWEFVSDFVENLYQALLGICIFGGSVGNALAFLVMVCTPMRKTPVSVYLITLSVSDTILLWWDSTFSYFLSIAGDALPGITRRCNIRMGAAITATFISTWLVVVLTLERTALVWWPFKAKEWQSHMRAVVLTSAVIIIGTLIFLPIYLGYASTTFCAVNQGWTVYIRYGMTLSWVTAVNIIPDSLLLVANCVIIYKVKKSSEAFSSESSQGMNKNDNKLVRLVMTVSLTHLCLTLPYMGMYLNINLAGYFGYSDFGPSYTIAMDFLFVLALYNHAINFFLYTASSQQFKANFIELLCCLIRRQTSTPTSSATQDTTA